MTAGTTNIEQAISLACQHHLAQHFAEAEDLYRAVLAQEPDHIIAHHNLGVMLVQAGRPEAALPHLKAARDLCPTEGQWWLSYAEGLLAAGHASQAVAVMTEGQNRGLDTPAANDIIWRGNLAVHDGTLADLAASPYLDYPKSVEFETLASCNATCTFCPHQTMDRKGARMPDALIDKIINELSEIPRDVPFNIMPLKVNEPFLDKRCITIIETCANKIPNATIDIYTNASPITDNIISRLGALGNIGYIGLSINHNRSDLYEETMGIPFDRTINRLDALHKAKAAGKFLAIISLSRVGDGTEGDAEFRQWVHARYPLFHVNILQRGTWLGAVKGTVGDPEVYKKFAHLKGCGRWFGMSITADGTVSHCCMDAHATWPWGNVTSNHVLDIYNTPRLRALRQTLPPRSGSGTPCDRCDIL